MFDDFQSKLTILKPPPIINAHTHIHSNHPGQSWQIKNNSQIHFIAKFPKIKSLYGMYACSLIFFSKMCMYVHTLLYFSR